jgi:hypothetical protein
MQLGFAPALACGNSVKAHILTAAQQSIGARKFPQFVAQGESSLHGSRECAMSGTQWIQPLSLARLAGSYQTGYLAFDEGQINSPNAGRFTSAINIRHGRLLPMVDLNHTVAQFAS